MASLEDEVANDVLQITEPIQVDKSIESFEFIEYSPTEGTNLNTSQSIIINIESGDNYMCPSQSYLHIEGRLTIAAGDAPMLLALESPL